MNLFFKLNWKKALTLTTFHTLFVLPPLVWAGSDAVETNKNIITKAKTKTEKAKLAKCLADVLLSANKKERAHEKVLLSIAGVLSGDDIEGYGKQINLDLLKALKNNIVEGDKLVRRIFTFCDHFDNEISELKIPNEEKVKLKVRIDELKLSAEQFGLLVSRPEKEEIQHRNCRILDVSDHLQVVVLSAGSLDGVRTGLIWNVKQADNVVVKVIAVGPLVCAAVVIEGELEKISNGMLVEFKENK